MPDCPVAAVLAAGAAELGQPELRRLAAELRAPAEGGAAAHYRRVAAVLLRAGELAARPGGAQVADLLCGDDMVAARMRVAAEVLGHTAAADTDAADAADAAGLLARAAGWQRYARGPVTSLSAACAGDVARGLLRRWSRGGRGRRAHLARARVELLGQARSLCAALRAELCRDAARTDPRGSEAFRESARRRADTAIARLAGAVDWELGGFGTPPAPPPTVDPPAPRTARLEHRLTALLGIGFGAGAALTLARMLGDLLGGPAPVVAVLGGLLGLAAGGWVARTRRVLTERALLERWVTEFTAEVRVAMEQQVVLRVLLAAGQSAD